MTPQPGGEPSPQEADADGECQHEELRFYFVTNGLKQLLGWEERCVKCDKIVERGDYNSPYVKASKSFNPLTTNPSR